MNVFSRLYNRFAKGEAVEQDHIETGDALPPITQPAPPMPSVRAPAPEQGLSAEEQRMGDDTPHQQAVGLLYEALANLEGRKMSQRAMSPKQLEHAIRQYLAEHG
jgi:hypothetical protein